MASNQTVDDVVTPRASSAPGGLNARPVYQETVAADTGTSKVFNSRSEKDDHKEAPRAGRTYKDSTKALLDKFEKESLAPHEQGDSDEEDAVEAAPAAKTDTVVEGVEATGDETPVAEEGDDKKTEPNEWQTKAQKLEARNREILVELENARKTPKSQRTERETALHAAEAAYIDEGSVSALRKFLSVVVGAAPDSKEVNAELAGLYVDLTAQEVGVSLDQSQQAFRDNARTRLLLARDRREKAEGDKKAVPGNDASEAALYGRASQHLDALLGTKGESGASLADEYPMLMSMSKDFDGFKPSEVLARAIRQEIMTGTLDANTPDTDMIRAVAPKIEQHYEQVGRKITAALAKKKTGTTTPSVQPKVAAEAATETRQGQGARTITTTTASRAPAAAPKTTKAKAPTTEKKRGDFKSDRAWREHLLSVHFKS